MLIYLDANIVQYCADYEGSLFRGEPWPALPAKFLRELRALQQLIELEQFCDDWDFAAPTHFLDELHRGRPKPEQIETYAVLADAAISAEPADVEIERITASLHCLGLRNVADERHLAIACTMGASWFVTHDLEVVEKVRGTLGDRIGSMQVGTPAECLNRISEGLFMV